MVGGTAKAMPRRRLAPLRRSGTVGDERFRSKNTRYTGVTLGYPSACSTVEGVAKTCPPVAIATFSSAIATQAVAIRAVDQEAARTSVSHPMPVAAPQTSTRRRPASGLATIPIHTREAGTSVKGSSSAALRFGENRIEIAREPAGRPVAELRGNLPALLGAAVGRDRVKNVIGRQLRFSGNLRVLWRLMALMRATS
jgi:hypothetical protein